MRKYKIETKEFLKAVIPYSSNLRLLYQSKIYPFLRSARAIIRVIFNFKKKRAYWWDDASNFGDQVTPFIIKSHFGVAAVNVRGVKFDIGPALVGAGSILNGLRYPNTVIWGSGFIEDGLLDIPKPRKVLAYRGHISEQIAQKNGWPSAGVYGDPGLLISRYIAPKKKRFKVGVVPHYVHKDWFQDTNIPDGCLLIDAQAPLTEVAHQISSCERVISSSLHGIIFAHSYLIPWRWMKLSQPLRKKDEDLKFKDFMSSLNIDHDPVYFESNQEVFEYAFSHTSEFETVIEDALSPLQDKLEAALKRL